MVDSKLRGIAGEDMEGTDMLNKSLMLMKEMRAAGGKVFHTPVAFEDSSKAVVPETCDVVVVGKTGLLDIFPISKLQVQLLNHGIKTVVLAGILTDCWVESTLRMALEKDFNVVTLTDCTATVSTEGKTAVMERARAMPCVPMTSAEFLGKLSQLEGTAFQEGQRFRATKGNALGQRVALRNIPYSPMPMSQSVEAR